MLAGSDRDGRCHGVGSLQSVCDLAGNPHALANGQGSGSQVRQGPDPRRIPARDAMHPPHTLRAYRSRRLP